MDFEAAGNAPVPERFHSMNKANKVKEVAVMRRENVQQARKIEEQIRNNESRIAVIDKHQDNKGFNIELKASRPDVHEAVRLTSEEFDSTFFVLAVREHLRRENERLEAELEQL